MFFHVTKWTGEPANREPDRCTDLEWFGSGTLPSPLVDYARTALAHTDARRVALQGWQATTDPQVAVVTT
jgi:8-oxo-dGTP diphosphatase